MKILLLNPVTRDGLQTLRVGRCQGKMMFGVWPNIEYGYLYHNMDQCYALGLDADSCTGVR
jgi:hypothetical protein